MGTKRIRSTIYAEVLSSNERDRAKKKIFPEYWLKRNYKEYRAKHLAEAFFHNNVSQEDALLISCETSWKKEFWLARGYSEEEAQNEVAERQTKNSKRLLSKYSNEERKKFNNATIEYYTSRGYSQEEAIALRRERQKTFSLEICKQKHGVDGVEVFKQRQEKWQNTLNDKPEEEKARINSLKGANLENFVRRYGEETGTLLYREWVVSYQNRLRRNGMRPFSKESQKWFASFIPEEILQTAQFGENEFFIHTDKRVYFYDFRFGNVLIEYHGHIYHFNERSGDKNWQSPFGLTIEESLRKDGIKRDLAHTNGFKLFEYYSNDTKQFERSIQQQILDTLNEENHNQIIQSTQTIQSL